MFQTLKGQIQMSSTLVYVDYQNFAFQTLKGQIQILTI